MSESILLGWQDGSTHQQLTGRISDTLSGKHFLVFSPHPPIPTPLTLTYPLQHTHTDTDTGGCKMTKAWSSCYCSCLWSHSHPVTGSGQQDHTVTVKPRKIIYMMAWIFLEIKHTQKAIQHRRKDATFKCRYLMICSSSKKCHLHLQCSLNSFCYFTIRKPFLWSCMLVHHIPYKGVSKVKCLGATNRRADPLGTPGHPRAPPPKKYWMSKGIQSPPT